MNARLFNTTATAADRAWHSAEKGQAMCSPLDGSSKGIFFGDNPLNEVFPGYLLRFILMNLLAQAFHFLLLPLKQPKLVCSFLAGLLVSPSVMGRWKIFRNMWIRPEEIILARTVGYLGIIYFLFLLAVKTDGRALRRNFRKASVIGFFSVLGGFLSVLASTYIFKFPGLRRAYFRVLFSAGMSTMRFPNIAYTLNELKIMASELGLLAVSCTLISEILAWCWLVTGQFLRNPSQRGLNVVYTVILLATLYLAVQPAIRYVVRRSPEGKPVKETYILLILVVSLLVGLVCDLVGSMQLGCLVFGLLIPNGPPLGVTLAEKAEVIIAELLFPIFYVSIGYNLDVSLLEFKAMGEAFALVMMEASVKLIAAALCAYFLCGVRFSHSALLGLMLIMSGPYDLHLYNRWTFTKDLDKQGFTALAISQIILMAIVTPLVDILYNPNATLRASARKNARFFIATSRNAELRVLCCVHGEDDVPGLISLLESSAPTRDSPIRAYVLHMNELIGQATPDIVPYDRKLRRLKSKGSAHIMQAFENYSKNSCGTVSIRPYTVIAAYRSMHEYICQLALQEHIPLIIIVFPANREVNPGELTAMRSVNNNVQAYSPCTVGLLVSRGVHQHSHSAGFSASMAVVFITGNDDREALALGIRMTANPNVRVTLIRIDIVGEEVESEEEKKEKKLDELLVHQFVAERVRNQRVWYHEIAAENLEQVMKLSRDMEGRFDIIVVGRKRRKTKLLDEDVMLGWSDNPELGVLGDMFASAEYLSAASVLVMQHFGDVNIKVRNETKEDEAQHLLRGTCEKEKS